MGVKYDPAIKNSDTGKQLYDKWLRIRKSGNGCDEFNGFMKFYNWAIESGFQHNKKLLRYDSSEPYSPDNCFWAETAPARIHSAAVKESIDRYNATVNRIRRACGMEPLDQTENEEGE